MQLDLEDPTQRTKTILIAALVIVALVVVLFFKMKAIERRIEHRAQVNNILRSTTPLAMAESNGDMAVKRLDFINAINDYEQAIKLDPGNKGIKAKLGKAYGDFAEACWLSANLKGSAYYYEKAVPLLEETASPSELLEYLKDYGHVLRQLPDEPKAVLIERKIDELKHAHPELNK